MITVVVGKSTPFTALIVELLISSFVAVPAASGSTWVAEVTPVA